MAVDTCLIRVNPREFWNLAEHSETFSAFISELRDRSVFFNPNLDDPVERVLYVEEFTRSLLTEMTSLEETFEPLNRALMFCGHQLGAGPFGQTGYHAANEVKAIADELAAFRAADLKLRFESRASEFRRTAIGYLDSDEAILAHQRGHFERLLAFYRGAAEQGDAMLVMVM